MYLFFKQDGSIEKSIINEYVMQGSSGVNYIYVYFTGRARVTYLATAFITLPNTDVVELAMSNNTFVYDGVEYAGYRVALDGSCTSQAGTININVVLTDIDENQLATYSFPKTVNETSVSPTSEISYAQYMALISMIFTMKSYNLGSLSSLDSLDTEMGLGTYTFDYLEQAYYMFVSNDDDDNIIQTYITANAGAIVIKSREYDVVEETWGEWSTAQESNLIDTTATTITSRAQLASVVAVQYKLYIVKIDIESDVDFDGLNAYSAFLGENNYITLCGAGTIYMVDSSPTYSTFRRSASYAELSAEVTKIVNGTTIALKASQDDEGRDIVDTYAAKSALSAEVSRAEGVEGALDTAKADKATTLSGYGITNAYTKTEADNLLNAKADKSDTYTKTEVNNLVASVYKFKGSVDTYDDLPTESLTIGDVYNVVDSGINYAWTGTTWDDIGGVEALATLTNDGLMSKEDFGKLQDLYTKAQLDTLLDDKADLDANDKVLTEQMPYFVEILHADLLALLNSSELVVGQYYRITDYVTTTVQANTQSAGHAFDILVRAVAVNRLDEHARALRHAGDTYFANAKLEAWQLKYSLVNDETFKWADTENGKGIIYYMKDEFNNELAYDFKNIKFLRDAVYYFTFTWITEDNTIWDASIHPELTNDENQGSRVFGNIIPLTKSSDGDNLYILNDYVFIADFDNDIGNFYGWRGNICQYYFVSNTFGDGCSSNTFGDGCSSNTFGYYCFSNTFGDDCYSNTFGDGCSSNTFGYYCFSNTFGDDCSSNTFGDGCMFLSLADNIRNLHVASNVIGSSSLNPLLIDDSAFVDKNYNIYIEQDADGNTIAYWYDDLQIKHGLYKASPTDETWTEMPNQFVNRTTVLTETVADVVASKGREIAIDWLTGSYICLAFYNGSTYDVKFIGTQDNSVRGKKGVAGTATLVEVFNASTTDYSCLISGTTFESYVASPSVARSGYYTINDGSSSTYIRGSTYFLTSAGVVTSLIGNWVNMTLETGWSAVENYTPQYKVFPYGVIFTRGRVLRGTGGSSTITIMPAGLRPSQATDYINSSNNGGSLVVMSINSTGTITSSANEGVVVELNYSYAL